VGKQEWDFSVWAHNICWRIQEIRAQLTAQASGETVIQSQMRNGNGFDFLSVIGTGANARLVINEVEDWSRTIPTSAFTALGLGSGGASILERNIEVALGAIQSSGLSDETVQALRRQLNGRNRTSKDLLPKQCHRLTYFVLHTK